MSFQAVAQEITELERNGLVNPAKVVEWAKENPGSALHGHFQWDDTECGVQWRLQQARELIIRVKITMEVESGQRIKTRKFVSLQADRHGGGGYREVITVLSDTEMRSQLLAEARRELAAFRRKFQTLTELATVFRAIDQLNAAESLTVGEQPSI